MEHSYLDTNKSVIISSPAGSGKTEKLARRYIALLKSGAKVERILSITFTEKASAEMKERILSILTKEEPAFLDVLKPKIPMMRISTIHSFCLKLLKRFSIELGLDPSLDVMDELRARALWSESIIEAIGQEKYKPMEFFYLSSEHGIRGADVIDDILNVLHSKRIAVEMMMAEGKGERGVVIEKILSLYRRCLGIYDKKKLERHVMDFSDLELKTYTTLSENPEWQNILFAFDEHTDHILVDEFQDTSTIQWRIIDKLTEEWRAGMGAKREVGKVPTLFLVGDEKQSIYLFRGANVSLFDGAKKTFEEWLGAEFHYEEAKENYRSLPEIVNFTNELFSRLMPPGLFESWRTKYSSFGAVREGKGRVALITHKGDGLKTKDLRVKEADLLAKTALSLSGRYEIYKNGAKVPCSYSDMVILLRRRTHLGLFENALRRHGIPFLVLKGVGFYDEPEVAMLTEFVSFLIDPTDNYALFNILRSPVFGVDYDAMRRLVEESGTLYEAVGRRKKMAKIHETLSRLIEKKDNTAFSILAEEFLTETAGWRRFADRQRRANVKKFISMLGELGSAGLSPIEIREELLRQRDLVEIPKANINEAAANELKIMTIHASKGLQFPIVFLPSMEEDFGIKSSKIAVDDDPEGIEIAYEPDSTKRKGVRIFERMKAKELEEQKRLFYVAVTRSMDCLYMIGATGEKLVKGRMEFLDKAFHGGQYQGELPYDVVTEEDVIKEFESAKGTVFVEPAHFVDEYKYTEAIPYEGRTSVRSVTEDIDVRARHGEEWVIVGRTLHRLFEELSKGILKLDGAGQRAVIILKEESADISLSERVLGIILEDIAKLKDSGILADVVLPCDGGYSELPFNYRKGHSTFKGRIDRLIIRDGVARIYDYKSFPAGHGEVEGLKEKYAFQMEIYKEAVKDIFQIDTEAFLVFTHERLIVSI